MIELSENLNRRDYMTENESGYGSRIISRDVQSQKICLASNRADYSSAIGLHFLNSARSFA